MRNAPGDEDILAESSRGRIVGNMRLEESRRRERLGEVHFCVISLVAIVFEERHNRVDVIKVHVSARTKTMHNLLRPRCPRLATRRQEDIVRFGMKT